MLLNALWVDDDSRGILEPFGRSMARRGKLVLTSVVSVREALEELDKHKGAPENAKYRVLIVDTILPPGGPLNIGGDYLGFHVAELAASLGILKISFLSVVPQLLTINQYNRLIENHPNLKLSYFNKTEPFVRNQMQAFIESITTQGEGSEK